MRRTESGARRDGFSAYVESGAGGPDTTTAEYAALQNTDNVTKTHRFLLPLLARTSARSVLDLGCGTGTMIAALLELGYDAYGADLAGLTPYWSSLDRDKSRFVVIDGSRLALPFEDDSLDFVFSFGAIEHVGTLDGLTDRLPNYRSVRRQWLLEAFRVVRPGGHLLIGGPNRGFPIDVAHAVDSRATRLERAMSRALGRSFHLPWRESFLWSYRDVREYLARCDYTLKALSVDGYLGCSRVPAYARALVAGYVRCLPAPLLGTGFNPWVMALIQKRSTRRADGDRRAET